jgi:hypothetical protein
MAKAKGGGANAPKTVEELFASNAGLWGSVCLTDPDITKEVEIGRRKFTSIDAYAQIQRATEMFGPMGIGWGFDPVLDWRVDAANDVHLVVCRLTLWYKWDGERGEIVAFGCKSTHMRSGQDDEVAKKVVTDALTKALSFIGFNADVFLGRFDDNKYVAEMREHFHGDDKGGGGKKSGGSRRATAFPAGTTKDSVIPRGEQEGKKLCEVPEDYLERLAEEGHGIWKKAAEAELARRKGDDK